MAEIVINVGLDESGLDDAIRRIQAKLAGAFSPSALGGVTRNVQNLGQQLANAFLSGQGGAGALNVALGSIRSSLLSTTSAATAATAAFGAFAVGVGVATAALVGFTAGAFSLAKASADIGKEVFDLADKTGISIKNIDLFRRAAQEAGKGIDIVGRSLDQFTSRLERAGTSTGIMNRTFRELGVDPVKGLQNANKAIQDVIISLAKIENPAIRAAKAQQVFGLRNEAIIPIITRIGDSLEEYGQRVGKLGQITEEQAKASKSFDVSLNILDATFGAIATRIGQSFLPASQSAIDLLQELLKQLTPLIELLFPVENQIFSIANVLDLLNAALKSTPELVDIVGAAILDVMKPFLEFQTVIGQTAGAAFAFFSGDFQGAAALAKSAFTTAQGIGKDFGVQTNNAISVAADQIAFQFSEIQKRRAKLSVSGGLTLPDVGDGKADKKAREFARAQLAFEKSQAENILKIQKDAQEAALQDLEIRYAKELISTKDFYEEKLAIVQGSGQSELNTLIEQSDKLEKTLAKTTDKTDRINLQKQLDDLYTSQVLKSNALLRATKEISEEYRKVLGNLPAPNLEFQLPEPIDPEKQERIERLLELQRKALAGKIEENKLAVEEVRIQELLNRGYITEGEAKSATLAIQRQYRDVLIESLKAEQASLVLEGKREAASRLDVEIEKLKSLGFELNNAQRFMKGFNSAVDSVGDAFERFGNNVSRAFGNIRTLFDSLKNAVKQFFGDLLGNSLQSLFRQTLGGLFGQRGTAAAGGVVGGAGGFGGLGGVIGGIGGLFRTPGFNPNGTSGVQAPPSASAGGLVLPGSRQFPVTLTGAPQGGALGSIFGQIGAGLSASLKGIGFGLPAGSARGGLAGALPLLGLSLGSGLGGSSALGQILGGAGGLLAGIGLTAAPAGAGFLAPLFSNPFTAIAGAGLLVGSIFLGRAKQRRADEQASDAFLRQALASINELKIGILTDKIDGLEAPSFFENQIIATYQQQISALKTGSVRDSRLKNQVADLRTIFAKEILPIITSQSARRSILGQLIPEFAGGGMVSGPLKGFDSVLARLTPGEMVLTVNHQNLIKSIAGYDVFRGIGVPDAPVSQVGNLPPGLAGGGVMGRPIRQRGGGAPVIVVDSLNFQLAIGKNDASEVFQLGAQTPGGQQIIARTIRTTKLNNEDF